MDTTVIRVMLLSSMFSFVNGIMLAGMLANLGSLNRPGTFPSAASDHLFSDDYGRIAPAPQTDAGAWSTSALHR
jgi:hypothetical protein